MAAIELDNKTMVRFEYRSRAKYLETFGKARTVTLKSIKIPKFNDRGVQCFMVGYDLDHGGDSYRMYNPITERVHTWQEIQFD